MNVLTYGRPSRVRPDHVFGWAIFLLGMSVLSTLLALTRWSELREWWRGPYTRNPSGLRPLGPALLMYANPQAAPAPAPLLADSANLPAAPPLGVTERDAPGVAVTFFPAGKEDDPAAGDARSSRMLALHVPAGGSPSPFLRSPKWVAVYDGALVLRLRDTFTFSAEGRGKLAVTVNDKPVLSAEGNDFAKLPAGEPVRLNKGKNKLRIRYEPPSGGDAAARGNGAGGNAAGGNAAGADASFRLFWTVKGENYPEPIPPTALSHNAGTEAVARGERLREGRLVFAEQRCAACHAAEGLTAKPIPTDPAEATLLAVSSPMPELAMDAPDLATAGARLKRDWMTVWINNPKALRTDPHMPRVFKPAGGAGADAGAGAGGADAIDPRSADVAAYLATLGADAAQPAAAAVVPDEAKVARGGQLFTHLNCNVCHEPPGAGEQADPSTAAPGVGEAASGEAASGGAASGEPAPPARVPLKYVGAKYQPDALATFLLNPSDHYKWIRMPNFRFSAEEADAVAAFLLAEANGALPENLPAGDPAKGKQLVESVGCLNCHAAGPAKSTLRVAKLAEIPKGGWSRGCMAPADAPATERKNADRRSAPAFHLSETERTALLAFAATDRSSLLSDAPAEFAARQVRALNCVGCHAADGKESLLVTLYDAEHKALEGRFPAAKGDDAEAFAPDQRPPLMTWFGEKLRPNWAAAFVAGQVADKPRPYLHARMPAFATRAGLLAAGMAAEHGVGSTAPDDPPHPKPDAALAAVGSKLSGRTPNESFSCTQCHAVATTPPFAPFEAPAVNFALAAERLRKDYYHRWVHNPLKLDPNTKMPAFEREDGKTTITTVYDGDARKQFEAIWQYLLAGRAIKPPVE